MPQAPCRQQHVEKESTSFWFFSSVQSFPGRFSTEDPGWALRFWWSVINSHCPVRVAFSQQQRSHSLRKTFRTTPSNCILACSLFSSSSFLVKYISNFSFATCAGSRKWIPSRFSSTRKCTKSGRSVTSIETAQLMKATSKKFCQGPSNTCTWPLATVLCCDQSNTYVFPHYCLHTCLPRSIDCLLTHISWMLWSSP